MGLGELSTLLVWGATTAYAIALVAFSIDLARLAEGHASPTVSSHGDAVRVRVRPLLLSVAGGPSPGPWIWTAVPIPGRPGWGPPS